MSTERKGSRSHSRQPSRTGKDDRRRSESRARQSRSRSRSRGRGTDSRYDANEKTQHAEEGGTDRASIADAFDPPQQNVYWRYIFLFVAIAYIGLSAYIFIAKVWGNLDSIADRAAQGAQSAQASGQNARSLVSRADAGASTGSGWVAKFFGTVALATASSSVAFLIAVFYPEWIFHASTAVLTLCGIAVIGVAIWNNVSLETPPPDSVSAAIPFGWALLAGVVLWVWFRKRLQPTYSMLKSVRLLTAHQYRFYILVFGWTAMQIVLALWSLFSLSIGIVQFQPGSDTCSDSPCGWGIVACLIVFYFLAHMWISATLAEILNTTLSGSYYSRTPSSFTPLCSYSRLTHAGYLYPSKANTSARAHLIQQTWALLGSRARNATLCETVEWNCWVYTNLDRVPIINKIYPIIFRPFIWLTGRFLESYNRYTGIVAATHAYEYDYEQAKRAAYPFIKRGHEKGAVTAETQGLGRGMGTMQRKMRTEREGHEIPLPKTHWESGLGAFLESHQTKSVLVLASVACAIMSEGFVYMLTYWVSEGETKSTAVDGIQLAWAFYFTLYISYYMMTAVEAGVNTLQVWLYDPWRGHDVLSTSREDPELGELDHLLLEKLQVGPRGTWQEISRGPSSGHV